MFGHLKSSHPAGCTLSPMTCNYCGKPNHSAIYCNRLRKVSQQHTRGSNEQKRSLSKKRSASDALDTDESMLPSRNITNVSDITQSSATNMHQNRAVT